MAYDAGLADRLRDCLAGALRGERLTEKRMFGGHAFLLNGHLVVSASSRGGLLLRVDPEETDELLEQPEASPFVMRGREMTGWLHVAVSSATTDEALRAWVDRGLTYARGLPPKSPA